MSAWLAKRRDFWPGVMLSVLAATGFAYFQAHKSLLSLTCPVKLLAGIPCLACGGGRSLTALAEFRIEQAFFFSPLFFAIVLASFCYLIYWLIHIFSGFTIAQNLSSSNKLTLRTSAFLFVALHYAHLVYFQI